MSYCINCGQEKQGGMKFCPNCGQDQSVVVPQEQRIPTENVPVPPPPSGPQQGGGDNNQGLSGLTKVVIGIIVLVVLFAIFAGDRDEETATSSQQEAASVEEPKEAASKESAKEESAKEQNKETKESAAQIGETVKVGDASWKVTSADQTNQITDTYGGVLPTKQGNFVIVDFRFRNDGNESKTLHQQAMQLVDSSGRESDPDTDTFGYIPQDRNIFLEQVNPGVTETGQVIFSVAPGGSGYKLRLKDTNLFRSERNQAEVDLGF
jgi:hypothetical protein